MLRGVDSQGIFEAYLASCSWVWHRYEPWGVYGRMMCIFTIVTKLARGSDKLLLLCWSHVKTFPVAAGFIDTCIFQSVRGRLFVTFGLKLKQL